MTKKQTPVYEVGGEEEKKNRDIKKIKRSPIAEP